VKAVDYKRIKEKYGINKNQLIEVMKGIKWGIGGRWKSLSELLEDMEITFAFFGGGGYFGLSFEKEIKFLSCEKEFIEKELLNEIYLTKNIM